MVREIATLDELNNVLSSNNLVVVDFTATWCGPCKKIAPVLEKLSYEYTDVAFVKVDVDSNSESAEKFQINSMPTFCFFKNNVLVHQFSGASEDKLIKAIDEKLK